jgi:hypothetical protein
MSKEQGQRWVREDSQFLLPFLRTAKYNVPKALERVKSFCSWWYRHPDIINGLCAESIRKLYSVGMMQLLTTTKDKFGNSVTVLRMGLGNFDKEALSPKAMMQMSIYLLTMVFEDDALSLHGATYVESLEGFSLISSMALSKQLGSSAEQKEMMELSTQTFPIRVRDIYVIQQPWYFSIFWAIVKPFLSSKLTKRLHLLGNDLETLHKAVAAEGLPQDFGGTLNESQTAFLDMCEAKEKEHGTIGGFAIPFDVEDPTGEKRRKSMATGPAAAGAGPV